MPEVFKPEIKILFSNETKAYDLDESFSAAVVAPGYFARMQQ